MEYCKNMTLSTALKNNFLKDNEMKKKVITQLAYVLAYIHEQKLIHKRIKPSNIFLDKAMNLKLGDFGDPNVTLCNISFDKNSKENPLCEISEIYTEKVCSC